MERKLLANAGIVEVETPQSEMKLEPVRCPRCMSMNAHYAQYCAKCSMILNEKAAMEIDESVEKAKASPEYGAILEALKRGFGDCSKKVDSMNIECPQCKATNPWDSLIVYSTRWH